MAVIKRQAYSDAARDVVTAAANAEAPMWEALPLPDVVERIISFLQKRPPQFPSLADA